MRTTFRTKLFVGSVTTAAVSLAVAAILLSGQVRGRQRAAIESRLTDEARLIADLLASVPAGDDAMFDAERAVHGPRPKRRPRPAQTPAMTRPSRGRTRPWRRME
jgi:hypothetical protein